MVHRWLSPSDEMHCQIFTPSAETECRGQSSINPFNLFIHPFFQVGYLVHTTSNYEMVNLNILKYFFHFLPLIIIIDSKYLFLEHIQV